MPFSPNVPVAIAPFWADIDTTRFGNIYYRRVTAGREFLKFQELLTAPGFQIRELFVVTYHQVAKFESMNISTQSNSFQVVLLTGGRRTYVFLSYGAIEWGNVSTVGFNSGNTSYTLPGATLDIEDHSNVGFPGLYVYGVYREDLSHPSQRFRLCPGSEASESGGSGVPEEPLVGGLPQPILNTLRICPEVHLDVSITSSKDPPVLLGDYIILTCLAQESSNSGFQFSWWHQDTQLQNKTTPTLVLPLVTRRELGLYTCVVHNDTVRGIASINITSQASSGIPSGTYLPSNCSSQSTRDNITREIFQYLVQEYGARPYGRLRAFSAASCQEISHAHQDLGSGIYWISENGGEPTETYCNL